MLDERFEIESGKSKTYKFEVEEVIAGVDVYAKVDPTDDEPCPSGVSITVKRGTKVLRRLSMKDVAFGIGNKKGKYTVVIKNDNKSTITGSVKVVSLGID